MGIDRLFKVHYRYGRHENHDLLGVKWSEFHWRNNYDPKETWLKTTVMAGSKIKASSAARQELNPRRLKDYIIKDSDGPYIIRRRPLLLIIGKIERIN